MLNKIIVLFCITACFELSAKSLPEFPFSKEMDVLVVADEMVVNGIKMRAYQFKTKDDEETVVEFYKKEWGKEMTDVLFGDWRVLSHKENEFLFTVQIEQGNHLLTHGTLGVTPIFEMLEYSDSKLKKINRDIGKKFPALPGTKFINDIKSDDMGRKTRTLLFSNERSIKQNLEFYKNKMQAVGWTLLAPDTMKKSKFPALAMNRGEQQLNLSFVRESDLTYGVAVSMR